MSFAGTPFDRTIERFERLLSNSWLSWSMLAALTLAAYLPYILRHPEFVMDDFYHLNNVKVYGVLHPFMDTLFHYFAGVRVIPGFSLYLDYLAYGASPAGYYLTNILIFLVFLFLAQQLLRRVFQLYFGIQSPLPVFLVLLMVVVHTEFGAAVYWISNRTESMMLVFYTGSLLFLVRHIVRRSWSSLIFAVFLSLLAVFSKAQSAHLPLLFLALWFIAYRQHRTALTAREALLSSIPLLLVTLGFVLISLQYDPRLGNMPWQYIPEKLMAIVGISLIGIAPTVSEPIYGFFVHNKPVAFVLAIVLAALLVLVLRKSSRGTRLLLLTLVGLYLITLFPRISYVVYSRINSIQALFLLTAFGLFLWRMPRRSGIALALAAFVFYFVGTMLQMNRWEHISSNERYRELIRSEGSEARRYYKLVTYQVFDSQAMKFARTGEIGYDSTFHNSPLLINLKYGSHAGLDYDVEAIPGGYRFTSHDPRTVYVYDSTAVKCCGLKVIATPTQVESEYSRMDAAFDDSAKDVVFIIERDYRYEVIKPAGIMPGENGAELVRHPIGKQNTGR